MNNQVFGRFEIIAELGKGSFGTVYSVIDRADGRELALKVFTPRWVRPHLIERFRREFALVARMPHPRIVQVFDFGQEADKYYFTMELLKGKTLEEKEPTQEEALNILCDVAEGLAFIHNRGILHLDLKPGNIFIDPEEQKAKIGDFGLARAIGESEEMASGTVAYIAPEILKGYQADMRADLYSLGVIAYEMFTGHNPFLGESISESINLQLSLPISEGDLEGVPDEFREILLSLLSKDPQKRPHNAYTVWRNIADLLGRPDDTQLRARFLPQSTLAGRDEIVTHAEQLLPTINGKYGWCIMGEKGIGYTRILNEMKIIAQLAGFYPIVVSPYNSLESLIMQLLSWEFGNPLRRHLPILLCATPALTNHPTMANIGVTKSSFEPSSDDIAAHLLALLEEISHIKPLLIMFEDGVPKKLIDAICQRQGIGKILTIAKNISTDDIQIPAESSELTPLTFAHIHIWVSSTLGAVDGLNDLVGHIQRESDGLPRKIDSTLKELVSEGFLVPGAERWSFSLARKEKITAMASPEILQSALKYMALVPDGLPYSALVQLIGDEWAPIAASELLASGKIDEREIWNSLVYVLNEPQLADSILPEDEQELKELKIKVAEALVGLSSQPEFVLCGAKLFYDAENPEDALKYARSITKQLRAKYRLDMLLKSYDLIQKCAEELNDDELWFRVVKRKAYTLDSIGALEESIAVYRLLLANVRKVPDLQREASVLIDLSGVLSKVENYEEAHSLLNEALEFSRQIGDARLELFALVNIAATMQAQGDFTEAANIFWQARNIATQLQNNAALVAIEVNLGLILIAQERYTQALDRLLAAASIAENEKLYDQRFESLLALSRVYRRLGNIELARRTISELKEYTHLPIHRTRVKMEQLFVDLYGGTLENPQDALKEIIPDLKSLSKSSYNIIMQSILPFGILSGIPASEFNNMPSIPTDKYAEKLWESIMSFESGQYDTATESAENLINTIKSVSYTHLTLPTN